MKQVLEKNTASIKDKKKLFHLFDVFHVSGVNEKRVSIKDSGAIFKKNY